jgi:hypothetical protein
LMRSLRGFGLLSRFQIAAHLRQARLQ